MKIPTPQRTAYFAPAASYVSQSPSKWLPLVLRVLTMALTIMGQPFANAQFAKDDEVELTRDEPLLFNGNVYRQGRKGETFQVAAYRADHHQIFLIAKDNAGKTFALSVPDAAVTLARQDASHVAEQAFTALRAGQLEEAQKELLRTAHADPDRKICAELALHAGTLNDSIRAFQQALLQQKQQQPELERQLHNAAVADRPNPLKPGDSSNHQRAEEMRRVVEEKQARLKEAITKARGRIKTELEAFDEITRRQVAAGAFSEALALVEMGELLADRHLEKSAFKSRVNETVRRELRIKVAAGEEKLAEAKRNIAQKMLTTARRNLEDGLIEEPGSVKLRLLHTQVSGLLKRFGGALALASSQREIKHYEEALRTLETAQADCTDDAAAEELATGLKKVIAEKQERLAKARTAEKAGDFPTALEAYDTYALDSDAKRVLPIYARQQEDAGNFLLAYTLFGRAELSGDMQRVQAMRDAQAAEYDKARILAADGKFADALAIYQRYKDAARQKGALLEEGVFLERLQKFDEALAVYGQANLADEIIRLKGFMANRESLLADAAHQEQAANYEKALQLYQSAEAKADAQRVAASLAKDFEGKKDYESALPYFEMAGLFEEAGRIRKTYDLAQVSFTRRLADPELYKRCAPACVTVLSSSAEGNGLGSGFFVAKGGYILTNHHVVLNAQKIRIATNSEKKYDARVVGWLEVPDLAVLKAEISDHPTLVLADSDKVETAAHVAAIGSPMNYRQSFTAGSISSTDREYIGNKCFQISVLINHGNSGGPLLDEYGKVIGINSFGKGTAAMSGDGQSIGSGIEGINFAIKSNEARELLRKHVPGFGDR